MERNLGKEINQTTIEIENTVVKMKKMRREGIEVIGRETEIERMINIEVARVMIIIGIKRENGQKREKAEIGKAVEIKIKIEIKNGSGTARGRRRKIKRKRKNNNQTRRKMMSLENNLLLLFQQPIIPQLEAIILPQTIITIAITITIITTVIHPLQLIGNGRSVKPNKSTPRRN